MGMFDVRIIKVDSGEEETRGDFGEVAIYVSDF